MCVRDFNPINTTESCRAAKVILDSLEITVVVNTCFVFSQKAHFLGRKNVRFLKI